jgi:hypothetical protein
MPTSTSETSSVMKANTIPDILDDDTPEVRAVQNISGRYIDQTKLMALLRMIFGVGAYDVYVSFVRVFSGLNTSGGLRTNHYLQMMHNSYCIEAPRKLSLVS